MPQKTWNPEEARSELLRARLTIASLLLVLFAMGLESGIRLIRAEAAPAALTLATAGAVLVLLLVAERGSARAAAHGLLAVFLAHGLVKIVGSGGETRIYWALALLPLVATATTGLRAGTIWSLVTAASIAACSVFAIRGSSPPFVLDLGLRPEDAYGVGAGLVLVSLGLAVWHEVLREGFASELRVARREQEQTREALDDQAGRYQALLEHSFDGAAIVDADGSLRYLRPAGEGRILGYRREDLAGRSVRQMAADIIHPEDWDRCIEAMDDLLRVPGKVVHEVVRLRGKDGNWRVIEAAGHNLTREPAVRGVVLNYRDLSGEAEQRNGEAAGHALPGASQERLRRFAGGVAHDFNNMLTVILGRSEQLAESLRANPSAHNALREVQIAARRLASLTEEIVAYAGAEPPTRVPVDLRMLVEQAYALMRPDVPREISFELALAEDPIEIRIDLDQVLHAIRKLVENAIDATPGPGRVLLSADLVELDADAIEEIGIGERSPEPGRFARVAVADDGHGIEAGDEARVTEPFFSTRGVGRGLGLSAVDGIVRSHGGALRIESSSEGSVLSMLLPLATRA